MPAVKTTSAQGKKLSFPKRAFGAALFIALLPLFPLHAAATVYSTATSNLSLTTSTIQVATIAASSSISMVVSTASAGSAPNTVSDSTTSYGISTNVTTSLTVSGAQLPSGVNFQLQFQASNGSYNSGTIVLQSGSTNNGTVTIASSVPPGTYTGVVTYTLGAPITRAPLASTSFNLTYTLS